MADEDFEIPDAEEVEDDEVDSGSHKEGEEKEIRTGLKKLLVKQGEGWNTPETGDEVTVHYIGTLSDGTKFDSSRDRGEPFTFKLGQGQVIKGWDYGIATMKKGENAVFTLPPELAYGESGAPPTIPPNASLKFDVELISWASVNDICNDGGVIKKILCEGQKYEMPKDADEVAVKFTAKLEDGRVVFRTPENGIEFYVKDGFFCPAIAKVVKTMKKGEKTACIVKPKYGFGEQGHKADAVCAAVRPNATLLIDLELLSWKVVEEVTDDKKVIKKVLKQGEGYEKPNNGTVVTIKYNAKLADGTVFEKRGYEEEPYEFRIDEEQVISGLEKAVLTMKKGEISLVSITPEHGFGEVETKRELAIVPPNSALVYEVELVSFVKEKESWDMDTTEKLEAAGKKKEEGNALFKLGKFNRASNRYEKAAKYVEHDSSFSFDEKQQAKVLKVSCKLNDAACKLKLKNYTEVVKLCTKVLELESQNVKALYRRAQAYTATGDFDLADWDLKKALEIDPQNRDTRIELKNLKQKQAEYNKKQAKLYSNMFANLRIPETKAMEDICQS